MDQPKSRSIEIDLLCFAAAAGSSTRLEVRVRPHRKEGFLNPSGGSAGFIDFVSFILVTFKE